MSPSEAEQTACDLEDERATDALLPYVYDELRQLSLRHLRGEAHAVTLSPTGLVHEAYLKMAGHEAWTDRAHFMAVASIAMRQVLRSRARARMAQKRGGGQWAVTWCDNEVDGGAVPSEQILALDEAVEQLGARDARLARLVEMRFYGGMEISEVAAVLGLSPRTAARDWVRAKAYLRAFLS